jgi:tRNA-dihydrouridine synthase A
VTATAVTRARDSVPSSPANRVSIAPMMDWTDRHCRFFFRLLAPDVRLYTEMVTAHAIVNGDRDRLLGYDPAEHPVALQLGGSEPGTLADAVRLARPYGYDEINLNIGCPSDRVQSGRFGACLMAEPQLVASCVAAMRRETDVPVTVKTRIGIDDHDDYEFLRTFVATIREAGCRHFVVHARKAILSGLSPKENRSIPPLRYEVVYRLKQEYPDLSIVLNGGIETADAIRENLALVDGVMIGRKAYSDPWFLVELCGRDAPATRAEVVERMAAYARGRLAAGTRLHHVTRHMLGLYSGRPGARRWRRYVVEHSCKPHADESVLLDSLTIFDAAA